MAKAFLVLPTGQTHTDNYHTINVISYIASGKEGLPKLFYDFGRPFFMCVSFSTRKIVFYQGSK